MIRQLRNDMNLEEVRYVQVDDNIFHRVEHEPDLTTFVEDWYEYFDSKRFVERVEKRFLLRELAKKIDLSDDSDDDY